MPTVNHLIVGHVLKNLFNTVKPVGKDPLPAVVTQGLAGLRRDNATFAEAWSDMAMRNLMADMVRRLTAMEAALTGSAKTACVSARETIDKVMKGHSPSKARYDNVACFGYRVKTVGDSYAGDVSDRADMVTRCTDMITAVRNAHTLAGAHNANSKMLKLFMAPEFFFRGANGAYDHAIVNGTAPRQQPGLPPIPARRGIVDLLRDELAKDAYKDWLFVLGTVIAATRYSTTVCDMCDGPLDLQRDPANPGHTKGTCRINPGHVGTRERIDGAMVDNIAIVMKEGKVHQVAKEMVSGVDYKRDATAAGKDKVTVGGGELDVYRNGYTSSDKASKFTDERMGGAIFTIDGITFGLEVCLDHTASVVDTSKGRLNHAANVQVQLIPSGGMMIGAVAAVPGGVVFNVDGSTPHVQAVGGGFYPEVRYDLVSGGHEYELEYPDPVAFGTITGFGALAKPDPNDWDFLAAAPKVTSGPSGSVLMYGPYPLP